MNFEQYLIESEIEELKTKLKDSDDYLKAPNGKKSNLSEKQWLFVRTKSFKKWFGDSKIVDENGEPLVLYHGTESDFVEFDKKHNDKQSGFSHDAFWFTNDISVTKIYGNKIKQVFVKSSNMKIVEQIDIIGLFPKNGFVRQAPDAIVINGKVVIPDINGEVRYNGKDVHALDLLSSNEATWVLDPKTKHYIFESLDGNVDCVCFKSVYDASDSVSDVYAVFDNKQIKIVD